MAMDTTDHAQSKWPLWAKRVAWLVLIWSVSVASLAIVAMLMRAAMAFAGFGR